ncbi:hypothetical protein PoB_002629400 [Plakobranchus ocellatus]|uniref:Uncharacterized protein n=1 Tax=Plakobranchus ocellatus TaxID=259542 RepID=A0AAV4A0Q3_9GAST|nr:hypothetical protein PoB_002629400 [Plakobranchus ocellatus]
MVGDSEIGRSASLHMTWVCHFHVALAPPRLPSSIVRSHLCVRSSRPSAFHGFFSGLIGALLPLSGFQGGFASNCAKKNEKMKSNKLILRIKGNESILISNLKRTTSSNK